MSFSKTIRCLAFATAISLSCAAPALAVPAGDEYLPQVPTATGDKPVNDSSDAGGTPVADTGDGDKQQDAEDVKANDEESSDTALAAGSSGDDGDDSGGGVLDTLLDPIVLLLIGGVLTIAVGLMLARRQNGDSPDPSRARRSSSDAPKPPKGEIVGGTERS